jgi:hypothetical protein
MNIDLNQLPQTKELFKQLNSGTHINHYHDDKNILWLALEKYTEQYGALFKALGFELIVDNRGFAYFKTEKSTSNTNKLTHRLALIMLLLFEYQADMGNDLYQFEKLHIDNTLIELLWQKHRALLEAEEINNITELTDIFNSGCRVGFIKYVNNNYLLLAAVHRYLDLFIELQQADKKEKDNKDES